jgi:hypothetical protein
MISQQDSKIGIAFVPLAGDTTVTSTAFIDTLGYDYAGVVITMSSTHATNAVTFDAISIAEADVSSSTAVSTMSSIVALTGTTNTVTSTSAGFVIPKGNSSVASVLRFNIDTKARKRYLFISTTAHTGTVYGVNYILSRPAVTADGTWAGGLLTVNA